MNQKSKLGQEGEDFACKYLVDKGFRIIERNLRRPWGELDIVAIAPDKTLVFVEVKTMKGYSEGLKPEDQMSAGKIARFKKAATLYAGGKPDLVTERGWRIDLIALTKIGNDCLANHYENI